MIRKFKKEDLDKILNIWLEVNIDAHNFISEQYWSKNYDMVKEILPQADVFVYEEENKIKGFVGIMDNYIAGIFVLKNMQSKGIGKKLLEYIKNKKTELSLNVYEKNNRAIEFYKKEKFEIVSKKIDENTNEIEVLMKWKRVI